MPPSPDLASARVSYDAARSESAARLNELALSEAELQELVRGKPATDPAVVAARGARDAARKLLRDARAAELRARGEVQSALGKWLSGFVPVDDIAEAGDLETDYPLVLLPVKIQTRFLPVGAPTELAVRIYPDVIFSDAHEEALSPGELAAGKAYWTDGWQPAQEGDAWRALLRRLTPPRAAYVVAATTPTNVSTRPAGTPTFPTVDERPGAWTRAAEARLLPDRWLVVAYRDGQEVHRALTEPLRDPLNLTPDPAEEVNLKDVSGDGLILDQELAWMVDLAAAEKAGMAVRMRVDATDVAEGFDQLLAVGVKASLFPDEAADRLARLVQGHHYGRGFAFVPQGTPTNNTEEGPSAWPPPDPGGSASFALERRGLQLDAASDGSRFAAALGLGTQLANELPHLAKADRRDHQAAQLMNQALWPATLGYYLEQMLAPGFGRAAIADARDHFVRYVLGRGPCPAFRVADVPYTLLPTSSFESWVADAGAAGAEAKLPPALAALKQHWSSRIDDVSRVGTSSDPDAELLELVALDASARQVRLREAWGADFIANLFGFYGTSFFGVTQQQWAAWNKSRGDVLERVHALLLSVGWSTTTPDPRVSLLALKAASFPYRYPLVTLGQPSDTEPFGELLSPQMVPAGNYIDWIRKAPIATLRNPPGLETPTLLFQLLRHAMLAQFAHTALDILKATEADRREPELVGVTVGVPGTKRPTIWDRLAGPVPGAPLTTLEAYLERGGQSQTSDVDAYRNVLDGLQRYSARELERLLGETLDVCSHRIDAWLTSLATRRLETMRASQAPGCHLGAYGVVEVLRPLDRATITQKTLPDGRTVYTQTGTGGYVHAPSMAHAATAAVLRSGFVNRAAEAAKPFALNLSSARTRDALGLLDAVRQGLSLGAILGYRFERGLHERSVSTTLALEQFIQPLRDKFPLAANKGDQSAGPASAKTAPRNVIDGLSLWRAKDQKPFDGLGNQQQRKAMMDELERIDDSLDAVSDLLLAESVHQLVRGNVDASGASVEAMADGKRPPDPEVALAPRGGALLTHRVLLVLGGSPPTLPAGWPAAPTPRAQAERWLDGWTGQILGDPTSVKCRASHPAPTAADPDNRVETEVSLADLGLRPIDVLELAAEAPATAQASELDLRVADFVITDGNLSLQPGEIRITYARWPGFDPATERTFLDLLELARSLRRVVGGARGLRPEDLVSPERGSDGANLRRAEAQSRATTARSALQAALGDLNAAIAAVDAALKANQQPNLGALLSAMRKASRFGVPGAFPSTRMAGELLAQARSAASEAASSAARAGAQGTPPEGVVEAVFGRGFVFLERFVPAPDTADELDRALGAGSTLVANDREAAPKWLQQAARVRAALGRWRKLGLCAGALGADISRLEVAQLPHVDGERWAALPFGAGPPDGARVSLVLHRAGSPKATDPWVGLVLDEWSEVIPRSTEQTGVAFHYDDAGSEAPQTILLAVPPDRSKKTWDAATVVDVVRETVELAKIRAVEGELLGDLGQLLPAITLASNPEGEAVETRFARSGDLTA
jgi:hypothetical protein